MNTATLGIYDGPPNASIARVMERFRRDIGNNQFNISHHANLRMIDRGVSQSELLKAVREGVIAKGKVIHDFIGGKFIYGDLVVVVYTVFGDFNALPNIITVYRHGEEDDYTIADLPQVEEVKKMRETIQQATTTLELISDADLEAELARRKEKRESAAKEAQRNVLNLRKQELEEEIAHLQSKREAIIEELEKL